MGQLTLNQDKNKGPFSNLLSNLNKFLMNKLLIIIT